jgi:KDO2-lipid IV(A) lauroyltransferase
MYYVLTLLAWIIARVPMGFWDRLASLMAWALFDLARFRRRMALDNLRRALGEGVSPPEARRLVRQSVHSMILSGFEVFHHALKGDLASTVTLRGEDHPRAALAEGQGRGLYFLCVHSGNIDAYGSAFMRHIAPGYAPAKVVGSPGINRFVMEMRERYGLTTDSNRKKGEGSQRVREALASGKIVGFYLDQSRPGAPRYPFFGQPAKTAPSLAALWRHTPAAVIPVTGHRLAPDRHEVEFFPPVELVRGEDEKSDLEENMRRLIAATEALVIRHPEQYLWMHDRYK